MVDVSSFAIVSTIWPIVLVALPAIVITITAFSIYWYCPCCRKECHARRLERHPPSYYRWVPDIHKPKGWKTAYAQQDLENQSLSHQSHYNHPIAPPMQQMSRFDYD